jgi:hypothetical protein
MDSGTDNRTLAWDLSHDHTIGQVGWPDEHTAFAIHEVIRATVELPAGKTFEGEVTGLMCRRDDNTVIGLEFFFARATTEEAHERMSLLGTEWNIDTHRMDAWFSRRMAQRALGKEDYTDTTFTNVLDTAPIGGPGGPIPSLAVIYSFEESRPIIVSLSFTW